MGVIEKSYILVFRNLKRAVNPVKKRIMKTECKVHKFINNQAVLILSNDGHREAYEFLFPYMTYINEGVVWADQDLKSSTHFFNPTTLRGLYGNSNARKECFSYYRRALNEYLQGDYKKSMFYFGAACHLIQDLTVPQHANVRLLNSHRRYEKWVVRMHRMHDEFKTDRRGIYLDSLKYYICLNSRRAIKIHERYSHLKSRELRFYKITSKVLVMAQRTTAGMMLKFFNDTRKLNKLKVPIKLHFSGRPIGYWRIKLGMAALK